MKRDVGRHREREVGMRRMIRYHIIHVLETPPLRGENGAVVLPLQRSHVQRSAICTYDGRDRVNARCSESSQGHSGRL